MKIGATYPLYEMGADRESLRKFAVRLEQLGFDYISLPDHVLATSPKREPPIPDLFDENDIWQDAFTIFGFLAAVTETIGLHTGICVLPQRPTALTARQAADVDLLSNGRFCLSVGLGWNPAEYQAMGQDFHTRGRRMDEQIELIRRLWNEDLVTFHGEFDQIVGARLNPRPKRQIPIWMGGSSEPAYRRAARLGSGFVFGGGFEIASKGAERVRFHLEEQGRQNDDFAMELMASTMNRKRHAGPQPSIDKLSRWRDWGGSHGCITSTEQGLEDIDQHIEFLAQIKDRIAG